MDHVRLAAPTSNPAICCGFRSDLAISSTIGEKFKHIAHLLIYCKSIEPIT
jgi:hypothetical protein